MTHEEALQRLCDYYDGDLVDAPSRNVGLRAAHAKYGLAGGNIYLLYPTAVLSFTGYAVNAYLSSQSCTVIAGDSNPAGRVLIGWSCNPPIPYDPQEPGCPPVCWTTHELMTLSFHRVVQGSGIISLTQTIDQTSPQVKRAQFFPPDPPFTEWCPFYCGFTSYCGPVPDHCYTCAMRKYYVTVFPSSGGGGGTGCPPKCQE